MSDDSWVFQYTLPSEDKTSSWDNFFLEVVKNIEYFFCVSDASRSLIDGWIIILTHKPSYLWLFSN